MATFCAAGGQLRIEQSLGAGSFGVVSCVKDVATAELFAPKDIVCQNATGAVQEIQVLKSLVHPNIIQLMTADQYTDMQGIHMKILMEYCPGGTLSDRLTQPVYDAMKNIKWMHQIAQALAYLHSRGVFHRNLKLDNVLLTDRLIEDVKLADFGLAQKFIPLKQSAAGPVNDAQYNMQMFAGTPYWMAPEDFSGPYTEKDLKKADVFSMGVLFFAIVERRIPLFNGVNGMVSLGYGMHMAMANGFLPFSPAFVKTAPWIQSVIRNLLSYDCQQRMNASDVAAKLSLEIGGKRVTFEQGLGAGGFGVVSRVRDVDTSELFALKYSLCPQNNPIIQNALQEINVLNSLAHPNVIKLMAADQYTDFQAKRYVMILMEYCSGGNLNDRLTRPSNDSMNLKWMRQIADALAYLHLCSVVHRDLKPENVLLTNPVTEDVKLADFGLARTFISLQQAAAGPINDAQCYMQTRAGTRHYMAPEVFSGHYTVKADMFSMGILFYAIVERGGIPLSNGKIAYGAFVSTPKGMLGLGYAMANGYPNSTVAFTRAAPNIQQLICNLLSNDYHQRMKASDVRV